MDGGLYRGGGDKRLIDVFIDRGCDAVPSVVMRELSARRVDVLKPGTTLQTGVLILGSRTSDGASSLLTLQELRRRSPSLLVYICVQDGDLLLRQITDYARSGADRLFTIGDKPDVVDLVEHVLSRVAAPPPEIELRAVAALYVPSFVAGWVQHVFRNAYHRTRMSDVGRALGRSVRRIDEELQNDDLPSLRDLWRCGQYAHLVELERRGIGDANDRARRTQLGTATEATKFRYRLRATLRRNKRLAGFAAQIPSLALLVTET